MRHILGNLTAAAVACVVLGVTAACGSSSSTAADPGRAPASDPAGNPTRTPGPIPGAVVLPLIPMTGAGGQPQRTAAPLNTPQDVDAFARQFRVSEMSARIQKVVDDAQRGSDDDIVGQIVSVGCDVPPGADAMVTKGGELQLVPHEVASPLQECLAAVTTVAIAVLPRN